MKLCLEEGSAAEVLGGNPFNASCVGLADHASCHTLISQAGTRREATDAGGGTAWQLAAPLESGSASCGSAQVWHKGQAHAPRRAHCVLATRSTHYARATASLAGVGCGAGGHTEQQHCSLAGNLAGRTHLR